MSMSPNIEVVLLEQSVRRRTFGVSLQVNLDWAVDAGLRARRAGPG